MKYKRFYGKSENKADKTRKTDWKDRDTYTYRYHLTETVNGITRDITEEFTLVPGEDDVTEEDIKKLHAMDDHDVYTALKVRKPPLEDWQKAEIERFREKFIREFTQEHGCAPDSDYVNDVIDEKFPKNWTASIEELISGNNDDDESTGDKSRILAQVVPSSEPGLVEKMDEIASGWSESWQEIYERVLKNGETIVSIARERGVSEGAVRKTLNKIKKQLSENEELRKFVRFFDK
jgi:hypothetical protein